MYNRYIPQPDGSYRRNQMREQPSPRPQPREQPREQAEAAPECAPEHTPECAPESACRSGSDFLRALLPAHLDAGDLLVVLLILLIAGDCPENRSGALLTLAMYLLL